MHKVYPKKRTDSGQYYLEIWVDEKGKDTRTLTLNSKYTGEEQPLKHLPLLDSDNQKVRNEKKSKNEKSEQAANTYADVVYEILKEVSIGDFFALINAKLTVAEIQKEVTKGKDAQEIRTKQAMKDFTFIQFVLWHIKTKYGVECFVAPDGQLGVTDVTQNRTVNSYLVAANRFIESVGYYCSPGSITNIHVQSFLEKCKAVKWNCREIRNGELFEFIQINKDKLKSKLPLLPTELTSFLASFNIALEQPPRRGRDTEENTRSYPGRREEVLVERIHKMWWRHLGSPLLLRMITTTHLRNFGQFLTLEQMKKNMYPQSLKGILNRAIDKQLLPDDLKYFDIKVDFAESERRQYLTLEEFQKLYNAKWVTKLNDYELQRLGFLFSCQCGLRLSDLQQVKWSYIGEDRILRVPKQKKTGYPVEVPLNDLAFEILGKVEQIRPRTPGGLIFGRFKPTPQGINLQIPLWAKSAGVNKNITFHSSRHTFVSNLINQGVDPFLISQFLGHQDLKMVRQYITYSPDKVWDSINKINPFRESRKFNL